MNRGRRHTSPTRQIVDADGNIYTSVVIGTQTWLVENLKTTHFNNGDTIPNPVNNIDWTNLTTPAYCWYSNNSGYKTPYGALYNFYAAVDNRGIAPVGFHVPTDAEVSTLITYLGGLSAAGGVMKETGTTHWTTPNTGATNTSGFTALPGGYRTVNGVYSLMSTNGCYGTGTVYNGSYGIEYSLSNTSATITRNTVWTKPNGFSIRCIKY